MKILIPSIQVPFIKGGAYFMTQGLKNALIREGHKVEILTYPFRYTHTDIIDNVVDFCLNQDFYSESIDKVIALQFPAYYINHNNKTLWLMHQHRAVYDLYHQDTKDKKLIDLKTKIQQYDNSKLKEFNAKFSISKTVSNRVKKFNNIDATPLYHPPYNEDKFYCDEVYNYIFFPSRLEKLKRQELLIEAMQYTKTPIRAIIAGVGGEQHNHQKLIDKLNIHHKIKLIGEISEQEKFDFYAHALAVVFTPLDEDYGYITLEAMLSSKPVLTCSDSGGVLEFITDSYTGFVVEPNPKEIAQKLDWFYSHRAKTEKMGKNAREVYLQKNISWENVVKTLLED